ncbi:hypothetical protein [Gordonia sihwensis]|uniref:hypothetical protein n=1 Tax=Gordonia sihwensis TaxID=173559 RepID=UPI0005F06878|nr:hypothetical protein [Gordonia sihwensis]KJR10563.1 hypothetical protein UG54_00825 [Gordonia sihwensis]
MQLSLNTSRFTDLAQTSPHYPERSFLSGDEQYLDSDNEARIAEYFNNAAQIPVGDPNPMFTVRGLPDTAVVTWVNVTAHVDYDQFGGSHGFTAAVTLRWELAGVPGELSASAWFDVDPSDLIGDGVDTATVSGTEQLVEFARLCTAAASSQLSRQQSAWSTLLTA